jgi:hypothetical protein
MAEETVQSEDKQSESTKTMATKKRQRSPAYPSYSLIDCIQFIERLYKKDGLAEIPKEYAMQHMGLDPKKIGSYRVTSSITGFGLLEEVGPANKRNFRFTEVGKAIVMLKDGTDQKTKALQDAVSKYEIIKQLRNKWPSGFPANDVVKLELVNRGFTERAAGQFASILRETYDFAMMGGSVIKKESPTEQEHPQLPPGYNPPQGFREYNLTLSYGKEVKLYISENLTKDDIDFMLMWIKRLDLTGPIDSSRPLGIEEVNYYGQETNENNQ